MPALMLLPLIFLCGCRTGSLPFGPPYFQVVEKSTTEGQASQSTAPAEFRRPTNVSQVGFQPAIENAPSPPGNAPAVRSLEHLLALAESSNPALRAMQQRVQAAQARAMYIGELPDAIVGANVFAHPIETAAGSQRANFSVMQMFPSLSRLDAQAQKAHLEALGLQQMFEMNRLQVASELRVAWYKLYVLEKQVEIYRRNQQLLKLMIGTASSLLAAGKSTESDVKLGTVEYSRLEADLLQFQQQIIATKVLLNRTAGRPANAALPAARSLTTSLPNWTHQQLRRLAFDRQPEIVAAHIEAQATRWGIEIAQLKRRPDVTLSVGWFAIDGNRPPSSIVDVGRDAWSLGAQFSLPLGQVKYQALEQEAYWQHAASHASAEETMQRYDALLLDLWQQARTADATRKLYETTILPQARDTLNTGQKAFPLGTVEFDRVIRDFRTLLTLELGYYRAQGDLAVALARIRQAIGDPSLVSAAGESPLNDTALEESPLEELPRRDSAQ